MKTFGVLALALTLFCITGCEKKYESGFGLREHKVGLYMKGTANEGDRLGVFDSSELGKAMAACESLLRPLQEGKKFESNLKEARCIEIKEPK